MRHTLIHVLVVFALASVFVLPYPVFLYASQPDITPRIVSLEPVTEFDCSDKKADSYYIQVYEPDAKYGVPVLGLNFKALLMGEFEAECIIKHDEFFHLYDVRTISTEGARGHKHDHNNYFTHIMVPVFQTKVFKKRG